MRFGILGPTELRQAETLIPLGATKQRGLLALLLLYAGRPVRVDTLVEHLWPGSGGTGDRRKIIYSMVSRLRSVLVRNGVPHTLRRVGGAYQLDVDPSTVVDLQEFRALVDRARAALAADRPAAAVADLERAVALWRAEPMADLRGPAAEHLRRQLNDHLLEARKLLAEGRLRTGRHDAVLGDLEGLLQEYDLDETLARYWITALCAAGREDEARRYLTVFRKQFRREQHVDPQIDLDAIRSGRPQPTTSRPHQLPPDIPGFVGRTDLLAELDKLAEPGPGRPNVVVITGMAGVGKTTLAIHWARRHLDDFADGQLVVDAAGFGPGAPIDPKEALGRFLHALGVPPDRIPEDAEDRRHRFNDLLDGRRMLILLDNVGDSDRARPLIPAAPTCLTLITSRHRLPSLTIRDGVHNLSGPPLPEDEAGALLARIVGERRAAEEPAALERLAAIAAGLPLALRVIGQHVAERPLARIADLAEELREQVLWAGSSRGILNTVFGWSYRALPPAAAALFRRLALHPGSRISLEAAAALAGADLHETERTLNLLARASMIDHDTARHYRLHDLLRQFAETRGATEDTPAEIAAVRSAITTWFLRSAANAAAILVPHLPPVPDLPPPPPYVMEFATEPAALTWCQAERENIVAATRYAARHGLHRLGWQLPAAVYEIFRRTGRFDGLIELNEAAVDAARLDGHAFGEVASLNNLGCAMLDTYRYDGAVRVLTAGRQRAAETGDEAAESICAHNLAAGFLGLGDTHRAIGIFHEVRAVSCRLGNRYGESATLHQLGDAYRRVNRPDRALSAYREALAIREEIGSIGGQGLTHHQISTLHLEAGELELAAEHCAAALAMHELIQAAAGRCDALITMADIEHAAGGHDAARYARAAVPAAVELGDSRRRVRALTTLAEVVADHPDESARVRAEAMEIAAELSGPDVLPLLKRLFTTSLPSGHREIA